MIKYKQLTIGFVIGFIVASVSVGFAATKTLKSAKFNDYKAVVNGNEVKSTFPFLSIQTNEDKYSKTVGPIREIVEAMGGTLTVDDKAKMYKINTSSNTTSYTTVPNNYVDYKQITPDILNQFKNTTYKNCPALQSPDGEIFITKENFIKYFNVSVVDTSNDPHYNNYILFRDNNNPKKEYGSYLDINTSHFKIGNIDYFNVHTFWDSTGN